MMTSVYIAPRFRNPNAMGGVQRVCEAQTRWLPTYDVEVVDHPEHADVLAVHATVWVPPSPKQHVATHCHGLYWSEYEWEKWAHAVNREVIDVMRKVDAITAPSRWVANVVQRGLWEPVHVIGHGVDIEDWNGENHNGYILWNKTRIDAVCDPRPVNVLSAALPGIRFVTTFGDNAQNVQVIGPQGYLDHKSVIQRAMLYLCTARETFGIGTLEAMACGVPVVGWNWGGQADIVTRDVGWLSAVGDYDDLKQGIQYCMENRDRMSQACRQLVERNYQWKNVVERYATLYKAIDENITAPKVSVVMPSYNLRPYLTEAMNSVILQDYQDIELIVVDDCSTDGSYELAKSIANVATNCQWPECVRVLKTPHNMYLAGALNYGMEHARGKYVMALDADNMLAPGALSTLVSALDNNYDLDIVYGRVKFVTEDGEPDKVVSGDGISRWPPDSFNYERQVSNQNQIPSSALYRRKIWQRVGGYRRRYRTAEDADFWTRATSMGARPAKVTEAVTLVYRNRQDSMSHQLEKPNWGLWYPKLRPFAAPIESISIPICEPIISVIIPVGPGHGDQGIVDALDSLYAQTMTSWECIVVDDTDDEIRWLPPWVIKLSTPGRGSGTSVARNIGINRARGQCFVLLDADDYLEPTALETMYQAWRSDPGRYVYTDYYKDHQPMSITHHEPVDMLHNLTHPITCMYPIEVRTKVKFDEAMRVGEDWDYVLGVLASGWCGTYVGTPLMYYRQASGTNRQGLKTDVEQIRQILNDRWSERIMACGCSSHKVGNGQSATAMPQQSGTDDMMLLEFIASDVATLSYTGPATGTPYRFGSSEGHRLKYVHRADAQHFLARDEFRVAELSSV